MKIYKKAVLPLGFLANGLNCGIKKSGKPDLAIFLSEIPAKAACKFTTNKICAAPVKLSKINLKQNKFFSAIVVNSGNANCSTGKQGLKDASSVASFVAKELDVNAGSILVASTGIIGKKLPAVKIKSKAAELIQGASSSGISQAKKAILTTDTFNKEITVKFNIGKSAVTICGVAKGAGMIAPNMATMLCFILTDANIAQSALDKALTIAVGNSFNCITVDGCMSTNDSVMLLANGLAANPKITQGERFISFSKALEFTCLELAQMIIKDAEGSSKFIKINIRGARSFAEARTVGLAIANSNLFKTAVYGENPNFGRISAAVGASGIDIREKDLKIKVSSLKKRDVEVNVYLGQGRASATIYTSDLTPQYIKINAAYN